MDYVYILDLLGYGPLSDKRTKIGIAKNVRKRAAQQFHCYGGYVGHLIGFFCFPNHAEAFAAELSAINHFPHSKTVTGQPREVFDFCCEEVISFVKTQHPSIDFVREP